MLDALYSKVGYIFFSQSVKEQDKYVLLMIEVRNQDNKGSDGVSGQGGSYCPVADMTEEACPGGVENGIGGGLMWKMAWCPLLKGRQGSKSWVKI